VKDALEEVISKVAEFKRKTYVVIDEGADLTEWLKSTGVNLIIVPSKYKSKAIAKGRAINYFIDTMVKKNDWYVFLDDDSYPLDNKFLYEISHYDKLGYIGANGNLIPRQGKSGYAYTLDYFRYLEDILLFRATQGTLKKPYVGFHGEGLILKGSVLSEIGFNRYSITEDFRFAMEVCKGDYKTWHSSTKICIKSPNSMKDLVKQRARWFKGIVQDSRHAPLAYLIFAPFHILLGCLSIFGSLPFFILAIMSPVSFFILFPAGTIYWIVGALILPKTSIKNKLVSMIISPVEAISPIYAIFMKKGFYVIDKSN
jgi:cellulose synthase/poly-beta-1,6-N-acetylglucosamine synthase-like glycosyltransferase